MSTKKGPQELDKKEPESSPSPPPDSRPASIIPPSRIDPEMLLGFQVRLREAWDCFRTDRLKEAETAARALITDLERGESRASTPQPRPQAEFMRLRAAARVVLGCVLDRVGQQAEALDLFAEAEGFFAQAEPGDNATGLDERYLGLALYFLGRGKNAPISSSGRCTPSRTPTIGATPPSRPTGTLA